MKQLFQTILLSILMLLVSNLKAQFQGKVYEPFNDPQVTMYGASILSPWCGGINSVQINHVDLDNDGKDDLVLYDHNSYIIKTFLNVGINGEIKYQYNPKFEKNFPIIYNYLILKDYNCDGIPDLFHKGSPGVSVFKGYYQSNELKFTYYKDLYFPGMFGPVNVFVQPDDIPSIMDIDSDGDIDVVAFGINGNYLEYSRNMQVEMGLPCDSMRMELFDNCYGKFFQTFYRTCILGSSCKGISGSNKTRHTGNCFVLLDMEGDNDLDFLGGNISFNDVQFLENTGTNTAASYTYQDTMWNATGHILNLPSWPAPFHVDIDNDNDKDILFTSHSDNPNTANYNAVAYYKNLGTDMNPNFVYQHDSLLTPDMVDVGSYSYPTFFDYDKDGKKDLFIGTEGYLDNITGSKTSQLAYFKNTSSGTSISFELVTKDFLGLSTSNYNGIFPTFGDITGDGIDDLLMGNAKGTIAMYKNYAGSNAVIPNFLFSTDSMPGITVGKYSAPLVYDFNQDGRTDLLVGNQAGNIIYYQDTSTNALKKLSLQTISLGNFKAGDVGNIYGYCVPFIGKMDNTNKEFLMIGNIDGT
ncbi:MAG TPA: VCBS repeat-containing protein, partial [Chitinophagaceae bacterium]|nr:VCBS repeat-containing protein [Chitinophagaceae bacterium]